MSSVLKYQQYKVFLLITDQWIIRFFLYNLYLKLPGDNYGLKLVLNKNI